MNESTSSDSSNILDSPWKLGGICGVGFVVLFIAGAIVTGNSPQYGDSAATIRKFFTDHGKQYAVGDWMTGLAVVFGFLPFSVALRDILAKVDRSGGTWARVAFTGALVWALLAGASSSAFGGLALTRAKDMDDSTLLALSAWNDVAFALAGMGLALMTFATAIVIIRTAVFWRWIAVLGFAAAPLCALGGLVAVHSGDQGVFDFLGVLGYLATAIFVLVLSIMMLVRKSSAIEPARASAPAVAGNATAP